MSIYEKNVAEPWFSLIKLRIKTVEGRLNKGDFVNMNIGDFIVFTNNELGFERKIKIEIKTISYYDNFQTYLENETLEMCLPGIDNIEDGLNIYYKYYKKSDELEYKIKAFTLNLIDDDRCVYDEKPNLSCEKSDIEYITHNGVMYLKEEYTNILFCLKMVKAIGKWIASSSTIVDVNYEEEDDDDDDEDEDADDLTSDQKLDRKIALHYEYKHAR